MSAPAPLPLFGADLQPCWLSPPESQCEPDPLESLDMVHAGRVAKRAERSAAKRRRREAPMCRCDRGPLVTKDDEGDLVCGRCGRWVEL